MSMTMSACNPGTGSTTPRACTPLSEDCLYLNVWQPTPVPTGAPVMVWIYGGGFGVRWPLPRRHRGSPGGEYELPGQHAGVRLHRDGGRSRQHGANGPAGGAKVAVTIFGQSAGGMSVGYHLVSPESRDVFNRAILQSGTALLTELLFSADDMYGNTKALAGSLGCPTEQGLVAMMTCLREQDAESLVAGYPPIYLVIDGSFIPENRTQALKDGEFKHTDILLVRNANEGMIFYILEGYPGFVDGSNSTVDKELFRQIIGMTDPKMNEPSVEAVAFQYTDWLCPDDANMYRDALDTILTDQSYVCPAFGTAHVHTRVGAAAYMYEFAHRPSVSPYPDWAGVFHGDDIPFVLGGALNAALGYTAKEAERYWANFARTG
ncbi:cholinesterase 1-like [Branchiostoma floridae x Branchiostoma japonicum]